MQAWTSEEDAILAGMKRASFTDKAIAKRLGRTISSVRNRREVLKAYRRLDRKGGSRGFLGGVNTVAKDVDGV